MCGIVGYIGNRPAQTILVSGLEKLEYRGYDSAGVATVIEGNLDCIRAKGKLINLREKVELATNDAPIGIGHTRWATHGEPNDVNAHPHYSANKNMAIIHNGIIENYASLKQDLINKGHIFDSEDRKSVV